MVKPSQILPGDAEYFGFLLIKSSDLQSYSNGHKKENFYFSVQWNPQFLCTNNGFTALKLVENKFWWLNCAMYKKFNNFSKQCTNNTCPHVHCVQVGIRQWWSCIIRHDATILQTHIKHSLIFSGKKFAETSITIFHQLIPLCYSRLNSCCYLMQLPDFSWNSDHAHADA